MHHKKKLKLPCQFQFDDQKYIVSYIRITLTLNAYQKSISNFYFLLQIHKVEPKSVPNAADQHSEPPNSLQNSLNGTSVFLEPHITVESSQGASGTKVTATAKFKLELHTPMEQQSHSSSGSSRPSSRSRSRRSSSIQVLITICIIVTCMMKVVLFLVVHLQYPGINNHIYK